ncbi:Kynurenine formamidase [Aquicella siphonis]|uniref:Kynurenine formamidase n=1 Tax=Aquicella siphonis TaxID=254247 RepID=A0A5E4PKM4_9COXI|nr:cyclase family protein [Aquicella siphonis]VVC76766.1 Kynurenine formamidase [Aquicella siphonis]
MFDFSQFSFIDLTHSLTSDIPHWGNGCGFQHKVELDYSNCTSNVKFRVQSLQMSAGIGTHMDAPLHCIPDGASIADIPLQSLIVPCRVIDVSDRANERYCISPDDISRFENEHGMISKNTFVIFYTGWDKWWLQPEKYRNELIFPSVSKEAAALLLTRNIVGIGIDTLSPDAGDSGFPVHQLILDAGKYIIENIYNAKQLGPIAQIIALPIKIQDGTEAPVRLVGIKHK